MVKYKAKVGAGFNDEQAQKIGEILEKIKKEQGGLKPESVIEKASDKKSFLHSFFDWNNTLAAKKWRKHQARNMINHITVVVVGKPGGRAAFESVIIQTKKDDEDIERSYVGFAEIDKKEYLKNQIIDRGLNELDTWINKYIYYDDLKPIIRAIKRELNVFNVKQKAA